MGALNFVIAISLSCYISDALVAMEKAMKRDGIETNDRQLACARIMSQEGQDYLKAMSAAANFAWVNRSSMTFLARQVRTLILDLLSLSFSFRISPDNEREISIFKNYRSIAKFSFFRKIVHLNKITHYDSALKIVVKKGTNELV